MSDTTKTISAEEIASRYVPPGLQAQAVRAIESAIADNEFGSALAWKQRFEAAQASAGEYLDACHSAESALSLSRQEVEKMRRALAKYGRHMPHCQENIWPEKGDRFGKCDCGLSAALASLPEGESG